MSIIKLLENLFHVFMQITLHLVLYLLRNTEASLGNGTDDGLDGIAVATMRFFEFIIVFCKRIYLFYNNVWQRR